MNQSRLAAKVHAVNSCHAQANDLYAAFSEPLAKLLNRPILRQDRGMRKDVVSQLPRPATLRRGQSDYSFRAVGNSLVWYVRAWSDANGIAIYHCIQFSVGEVRDDGTLLKINPPPQFRTDYTVNEVIVARENLREARQRVDAAEASLFPFKEHDE